MFESLTHEILCARGDFLVRDLDAGGSKPFRMSFLKNRDANHWEKGDHSGARFDLCTVYGHIHQHFPERKPKEFGPVTDAEVGYYSISHSQTFKTIDSLVQPDPLFQMAVSTSHGINESGLDDLEGILNSSQVTFYFVTLVENVSP